MRKITSVILCGAMALSLVACGNTAPAAGDTAASSTEAVSETVKETEKAETAASTAAPSGAAEEKTGETGEAPAAEASSDGINVCLGGEPVTLDPALNSSADSSALIVHLFAGIAKWAQDSESNLYIEGDCVAELPEPVMNSDGTVTYTYILRDGLKWSDGKPVTAGDFVYSWNRAASPTLGADYAYMFSVIDGYAAMWETDSSGAYVNPDAALNVKAVDDSTLEVTLINPIPYWNELLAFTAYMPVREDVVAKEGWDREKDTLVCNGPYYIDSWEHDKLLTLKKNEGYIDAVEVTMPAINCYLSEDEAALYKDFQDGKLQFLNDVPRSEIEGLKASNSEKFCVGSELGTYYFCWNVNEDILPEGTKLTGAEAENAREDIRNSLSLMLDRNYIAESIGQAGQIPASSFVALGLTDADGSQFYQNAGSREFYGYFDVSPQAAQANYDLGMEVLKKYYKYDEASGKFTDFPELTYLYNVSDSHKAIGEYIQKAFGDLGITVKLEEMEWDEFLVNRKEGNFTLARNGWLADYNDPVSFLDLWVSYSGNDDAQLGKGDNASMKAYSIDLTNLGYETKVVNGTWAETYDVLIGDIKSCTDDYTRYALMHMAEDLLMSTGVICPLYYYTDVYMLDPSVQGFYTSPLGYKFFMYSTVD
ncbi:MAG: peptide ABC transporter substrate-binding protein [Lachnospiraceae bacterium]|nr:peptide ABC transporter substrate-binding protein [Lachnospiraceae bacterium]